MASIVLSLQLPMSPFFKRRCPECKTGVAVASNVRTIPGRPGILKMGLRCSTCGYQWSIEYDRDMPLADDTETTK